MAHRKRCQEPRCSPRGNPACRGTFGGSHEGFQGPFCPSGRNRGLPLRRRRGQGPHLAKRWEPCGVSRVAVGFWRSDGDLRLPLGLALGSLISPRVARESWGCARVTAGPKRPHLGVCPGPNIPLQGRQGSRGCIPGSTGDSGLVSKGSQGLRPFLESRRGSLGAP